MISIIICSRKSIIDARLSENINDTIGCEYELIIIDNSESKYSIFEAYNLGIRRSNGNYLCFIHDDILFHTLAWGNVIKSIFQSDLNVGLIGVAGAKLKTKMPSGYWNCPNIFKEINILQHSNEKVEMWNFGFENNSLSRVVAIDGVFMVLKKENNIKFNEILKGYHNYDLNISLENYIQGFKTVVTNQILIEHYSEGNINKSWYDSTYKIHQIYKAILPISLDKNVPTKELEIKNGFNFLKYYMKNRFYKGSFNLWVKLFLIKPFTRNHIEISKIFFKSCYKSDI